MPRLWDVAYPRTELLRHVGRLEQVAGVRLVTLGDGSGRGIRVLEFRTGSGFAFEVLVDRSFDVGRCEMGGRPLSWLAPPGTVGPWYYEPDDWGWFRSWGGGMVVTCGLDHTMVAEEDTAEPFHQPHMFTTVRYGLHGRVGGLPARLVGYGERWDGDACTLWAEGIVVQAAVFGEQLTLRRRIEATIGESSLRIHDQVENVGFSRTSHMLLYHCNAGFPVVDEGSELLVPNRRVTADPWVEVAGHAVLPGPVADAQEACFYYEPVAAADGTVPVAIVNRRLDLGVYQVFRAAQLPHFMVWRMPGEGTYAVGLEPGTNPAISRAEARRLGKLIELEPGESRGYDLELGALAGPEELDAFAKRVSAAAEGAG
jgi:Domain of unknown function (DUF4432)